VRVHPIASTVSDNFFYLVTDGDDALLVDPIDPEAAVRAISSAGAARVRILTTHGHPDHVGGNAEVVSQLGCEVIASRHARTFPVEADTFVGDGDVVQLGASSLTVRHAPGHTDGHIVLHDADHLISGDVFFVAGAGNCRFGGDPRELFATFYKRLADLPAHMTFYPGHDYAVKNLEFIQSVEPSRPPPPARVATAHERSRADGPVLTTLGEERMYNPFHRAYDAQLQRVLEDGYVDAMDTSIADPAERTFCALRALRDRF